MGIGINAGRIHHASGRNDAIGASALLHTQPVSSSRRAVRTRAWRGGNRSQPGSSRGDAGEAAEIPIQHGGGWNKRAIHAAVQHLVIIFVALEKENFLSALIKSCSGDEHGPTDAAAWIIKRFIRPRNVYG